MHADIVDNSREAPTATIAEGFRAELHAVSQCPLVGSWGRQPSLQPLQRHLGRVLEAAIVRSEKKEDHQQFTVSHRKTGIRYG